MLVTIHRWNNVNNKKQRLAGIYKVIPSQHVMGLPPLPLPIHSLNLLQRLGGTPKTGKSHSPIGNPCCDNTMLNKTLRKKYESSGCEDPNCV